jgi:hypothetical protein
MAMSVVRCSCWFDLRGSFNSTSFCVAATKAGHQGRFGGSCLDHPVAATSTKSHC